MRGCMRLPDSDQLQNPPEQQQTRPDKTEAPNLALSTIITLTLLALITAGAAVVGLNALFQPFPGEDDPVISDPDSTPSATCEEDPAKEGKAVHARDVTVNVFNAGSTAGLASTTLMTLGERGFQIGVAGNAPSVPRYPVFRYGRPTQAAPRPSWWHCSSAATRSSAKARIWRLGSTSSWVRSSPVSSRRPVSSGLRQLLRSVPIRPSSRTLPTGLSQSSRFHLASRPRNETARSRSSVASRCRRGVTTNSSSPRLSTVR